MGAAHLAGVWNVHDLGATDDGGHGQARGHSLARANQIRLDAVVLEPEPRPGPPEARLYLIEDEQDTVTLRPLTQGPNIVRRHECHGRTLERLRNDPGEKIFIQPILPKRIQGALETITPALVVCGPAPGATGPSTPAAP